MSTANEAWIQDSLTRLETLEKERDRLKWRGPSQQLTEVEEEIASLYEVLEAAAEGGGESAEEEEAQPEAAANQGRPVTREFDPPASPWESAPAEAQPFAHQEVASPFESPSFAAPSFAAPEPMASFEPSSFDAGPVDLDEPKSFPVIPIAAALVVVLAAGGWFVMGDKAEAAAPAAPAAATSVIQSAAIPDDTQNPNVAKGANVDRTKATVIKMPKESPRSSNDGPRQPRPEKPEKPSGHNIKVDKSMDPLGGVK